MSDDHRYRQLMDEDYDPPLFECRDCNIIVTETAVHDRWHRIQDRHVIGREA